MGKGRMVPYLERGHQQIDAAIAARHVDVIGARFFQRQSYEFAAALDRRPVIQFVGMHHDCFSC
jgi:hypothetical protein